MIQLRVIGLSLTFFVCGGIILGVWAGDVGMGLIWGLYAGVSYTLFKVIMQLRK